MTIRRFSFIFFFTLCSWCVSFSTLERPTIEAKSKEIKDLKNQKSQKRKKSKKRKKKKLSRQRYRVVKGETWTSVAKLLNVKVKDLKRWNKKISRQPLKPGKTILFYGKKRRTESRGRPNRGQLINGVHLDPDGDGVGYGFAVSTHRTALWGTPELVSLIHKCGREYRRYFSRKYAPIAIGDLSSRSGGALKKHKSHQSGRDVDIGLMRKKPLPNGYFQGYNT